MCLKIGIKKILMCLKIGTIYVNNPIFEPFIIIMKTVAKADQVQQGELPDQDPTPSESTQIKPNPKISIPPNNNKKGQSEDRDDSSGEIEFETVVEKDYNKDHDYSPEKKKKKIQKQEIKSKTKEREKQKVSERATYEKGDKKQQKRSSPSFTIEKEEVPQQREFQPQQQFYHHPYMYLPPVNHLPPPMYPPFSPTSPYLHNNQFNNQQFKFGSPLHPIPPPINHPHYGHLPQPMYPIHSQPKPIIIQKHEPPKFQPPFKSHHPLEYSINQFHNPQQQANYQINQINYPNNHHQSNQHTNISYTTQHPKQVNSHYSNANYTYKNPQNIQPITPPIAHQPITQQQVPKEEKRQKPQLQGQKYQSLRDKKIDYKEQVKRELKKSLKVLPSQTQEQILQAMKCIIKYAHLSQSLFSQQSACKEQISLGCLQKSMIKIEKIINQDNQQSQLIYRVMNTLQMRQAIVRLKERKIFRKIITKEEVQNLKKLKEQLK